MDKLHSLASLGRVTGSMKLSLRAALFRGFLSQNNRECVRRELTFMGSIAQSRAAGTLSYP